MVAHTCHPQCCPKFRRLRMLQSVECSSSTQGPGFSPWYCDTEQKVTLKCQPSKAALFYRGKLVTSRDAPGPPMSTAA